MKEFAELYDHLALMRSANEKRRLLFEYFKRCEPTDRLWALAIICRLSDRLPKRLITASKLKLWAKEASDLPGWIFEEAVNITSDIQDGIAILDPCSDSADETALADHVERLMNLQQAGEEEQQTEVIKAWSKMNYKQKYLYNKLITATCKFNVSKLMVASVIAELSGMDKHNVIYKMTREWSVQTSFETLFSKEEAKAYIRPYPFLENIQSVTSQSDLDALSDFQVERILNGNRAQLIIRNGQCIIWTADERLVNEQLPELQSCVDHLAEGTVIDGQLVCVVEGASFLPDRLEQRLKLKRVSKTKVTEHPVSFVAYDLLEEAGVDLRSQPLRQRRSGLEELIRKSAHPNLLISDVLNVQHAEDLEQHRKESKLYLGKGLMLKEKAATYHSKESATWWKWKSDRKIVHAVLIYVSSGEDDNGIYTECTFALPASSSNKQELIPFAKARTGLSVDETKEIHQFVKQNTIERFGPVRSITPELVFELSFQDIYPSTRHKCGFTLTKVRIDAWLRETSKQDLSTLASFSKNLEAFSDVK